MSTPSSPPADGEVIRALAGAIELALGPGAGEAHMIAARDAAQIVGLPGLDLVLSALQPHVGRPWPVELQPVLERVQRLASESIAAGDLRVFRRADRELAALAGELRALEWSEPIADTGSRRAAIPTLRAADVLNDFPIAGGESRDRLLRLRLTAPVAAALRAALDWLGDESEPARPLKLSAEDSALEVTCERVDAEGLRAADKVLSTAGGNLGPVVGSGAAVSRAWTIRVPTFAKRNSYLMLIQGRLRLAVPWHAVLRVRMVPAAGFRAHMNDLGLPVIGPIEPLSRFADEYPVVLVAHGLKRAYLIADRLVWRLEADPCEAGSEPPAPGLSVTVQTEEGERYWLADPGWLLSAVETPPLGELGSPQPAGANAIQVLGPESVESLPATPESPATAEAADGGAEPSAPELPAVAAATVPAPAAPAPATPESARPIDPFQGPRRPSRSTPRSQPRRALVAEDSISARIFLSRLLEQQGWVVRSVSSSAELFAELRAPAGSPASWGLVCVDVDLPDAQGVMFLRSVVDRQPEGGTAVVALVRDAADITVAKAAGIHHTLSKPFGRESLVRLLERLGLAPRKERG